jgi:hypothetical protein
MSITPGATTSPRASMRRFVDEFARRPRGVMRAILPPAIATSP